MKQHDLIDFLVLAAEQGASDLHLTAGAPPMMRIAGVIKPLTEEPLSAEDTRRLVVDAYSGSSVSGLDRKSTRLNSSHITISYAVFCLKKKKKNKRKKYPI